MFESILNVFVRRRSECDDVEEFVVYWKRQIYSKNKKFPVKILSKYQLIETMKQNNVDLKFASGDAIHVLQEFLEKKEIDYILSDNAETCAHVSANTSWCRLSTLKLPFGDVIKKEAILGIH